MVSEPSIPLIKLQALKELPIILPEGQKTMRSLALLMKWLRYIQGLRC